jgi:hypothetical protein
MHNSYILNACLLPFKDYHIERQCHVEFYIIIAFNYVFPFIKRYLVIPIENVRGFEMN